LSPDILVIVRADAFALAEGNNRAPRGGETVTMMWIEAPTGRCGVEVKTVGNSNSPHLRSSSKVRRNGLTGVCEQGMSTKVPQKPGIPERFRREQRRYCVAKGRPTRGGKAVRESEHPIVPMKQGQLTERPCGGKGVPGHGTVGGNDERDIELEKHLNET